VDRGFLVCKLPDDELHQAEQKRVALQDVRGVIAAVPGLAFTNACISRLLAQDSVILHCDEEFKPIGWTVPLERVIRREVFANQIQCDKIYQKTLWSHFVLQKMRNQASALSSMDVEHDLSRLIEYWKHYFGLLRAPQIRERKGAQKFENQALNYGYAVLATLVHRACLMYGLLPSLGIHHDFRYRSTPLVYDVMEPYRPFIDLILAEWIMDMKWDYDGEEDWRLWVQFLMNSLRQCRIKHPEDKHSHKLLDAIDKTVRGLATCYEDEAFYKQDNSKLWLPRLEAHYWLREGGIDDDEEQELGQQLRV